MSNTTVHYEYVALAKKTSGLREAMLSFVKLLRSVVNNNRIEPCRVCGHLFETMFKKAG